LTTKSPFFKEKGQEILHNQIFILLLPPLSKQNENQILGLINHSSTLTTINK